MRVMSTLHDPTDTRLQEREALLEEQTAREIRKLEVADLKWLAGNVQGRRIVWRLLDRAGIYRSSFNHSGSLMAFAEGKRDMGLFLLAEVSEASPGGFLKLIAENQGSK